jgi:uncharacterized membrane protein YeaQ/YmgE (transglycosylase-associated protein family)
MGILGTILVGLIVGARARWLMPSPQPMGWIASVLGTPVRLVVVGKLRGSK